MTEAHRPRVLILGIHDIKDPRSGAALRTRQHHDVLSKTHDVRYWAPTPADWSTLTFPQRIANAPRVLDPRYDPFANYAYDAGLCRTLIQAAYQFYPDTVIMSEHYTLRYAEALKPILPGAHFILDAHNHEATLQASISGSWRARMARRNEQKAVHLAHELWVCSEEDGDAFGIPYKVIPNGIKAPREAPIISDRVDLVGYIGGYDYAPNREAAEILAKDIAPSLRPGTLVELAGKHAPLDLAAEHVQVVGHVDNAEAWFQRIGIVCLPIMKGGGTRLKVIEALSHGKPLVATTKAIEGFPLIDGVHCLIREPSQMGDAIHAIQENRELRESLHQNAVSFAESYLWENMTYA